MSTQKENNGSQLVLPSTWRWAKLHELITETRNGLYKLDSYYGRGTRILKMFNIGRLDGTWNLKRVDQLEVTQEELGLYVLEVGDILVNRVNSRELVGKCAVVDDRTAGSVFESKNIRLRINRDRALHEWVAAWLNASGGRRQINDRLKQIVGQATISRPDLDTIDIPLPPLVDQRRIAGRLREQLAEVAKVRTALQAQLTAAQALPDALLRAVFDQSETQCWPQQPLGELVYNCDGRRIPLKQSDRATRKGPYPYYGASGVIDSVDEFLFDGDFLLIGEDGANLLSRSTPIAFKASGKFWVNNHAHVVQPREAVLLDYLEHFFAVTDLTPYVAGSAQPKLSQASMNDIPVPVPPLALQRSLTTRLAAELAEVTRLRETLSGKLETLDRLPAALLAQAFQGCL